MCSTWLQFVTSIKGTIRNYKNKIHISFSFLFTWSCPHLFHNDPHRSPTRPSTTTPSSVITKPSLHISTTNHSWYLYSKRMMTTCKRRIITMRGRVALLYFVILSFVPGIFMGICANIYSYALLIYLVLSFRISLYLSVFKVSLKSKSK